MSTVMFRRARRAAACAVRPPHRASALPCPRPAVPVPVPGHGRARAALSRRPEQAVPPWCFGACVQAGCEPAAQHPPPRTGRIGRRPIGVYVQEL